VSARCWVRILIKEIGFDRISVRKILQGLEKIKCIIIGNKHRRIIGEYIAMVNIKITTPSKEKLKSKV